MRGPGAFWLHGSVLTRWGPRIDVRAVFALEQDELLSYLYGLADEQWNAVTVADSWRVRDVVAHLLGDHLGRLSRARDGYIGVVRSPEQGLAPFLHRLNAEWVTAAERLSPRVLVELLEDVGPRVVDHWRDVDLDALGEPVSWAGPGPAPVWLDAARDYTEYWVHQQQIREATGGDLLLSSRFFSPVVSTFARALPHTLRHLADRLADAALSLVVTGDSGGTWTVRSDGTMWLFEEEQATVDATSVTIDEDGFWRLCTRSLSARQAVAAVGGDADPAVREAVRHMTAVVV